MSLFLKVNQEALFFFMYILVINGWQLRGLESEGPETSSP